MNTSAQVDPQKSGHAVWEEFSQSFTPAVKEVVEFAKKIPGFRDLSQHDQVSLLKAGTFEVRALTPVARQSPCPTPTLGLSKAEQVCAPPADVGGSFRLAVRREEPHCYVPGREEVQHGHAEGHGGRRPAQLHV